jgi:hypothetical protein
MVLQYAESEDKPFANIGRETASPNMWPLCLSGRVVRGEFQSVSTEARSIGIMVGTPYIITFSPHTYSFAFTSAIGVRGVHGHYTWSLAESWRDSMSGGQNTRQSELDLGVIWGDRINGTCLASNKNVGTFTSQLGVASFNVSEYSSLPTSGPQAQ